MARIDREIAEYDYDWLFVEKQDCKRRLIRLFEAIDSGDTDLYWSDRDAWNSKHHYPFNIKRKRSTARRKIPKYDRDWFKLHPDKKPFSSPSFD